MQLIYVNLSFFFSLRLKDNIFNFGIDLPLLDIDSHYNLVGKILVLPLVGNGPCKLNLKDVRTIITTNYTIVQKENREVMHVDEMKVNFKVGYMHIKLDNLFNGNKVLGKPYRKNHSVSLMCGNLCRGMNVNDIIDGFQVKL